MNAYSGKKEKHKIEVYFCFQLNPTTATQVNSCFPVSVEPLKPTEGAYMLLPPMINYIPWRNEEQNN